jgi:glycosyltransferase involved in cell wall biosynthesis
MVVVDAAESRLVRPEISVVIPLRDEAANVQPLVQELTGVMDRVGRPYEVILIDDGSKDATFEQLRRVQAADSRATVIQFDRNFGQTAAFAAGFAQARGDLIVTLDGDLQNDPADIPRLLEVADTYDIVVGWRRNRQDSYFTRHIPSVVANWLLGIATGIRLHDYGCSLKVLRAAVVRPLRLSPGMHRYLPAIASQLGDRVTEVPVNHRPRRAGRSKYGLSRTFTVVRDIAGMRSLMRRAVDPASDTTGLYVIRQLLEREPSEHR